MSPLSPPLIPMRLPSARSRLAEPGSTSRRIPVDEWTLQSPVRHCLPRSPDRVRPDRSGDSGRTSGGTRVDRGPDPGGLGQRRHSRSPEPGTGACGHGQGCGAVRDGRGTSPMLPRRPREFPRTVDRVRPRALAELRTQPDPIKRLRRSFFAQTIPEFARRNHQ